MAVTGAWTRARSLVLVIAGTPSTTVRLSSDGSCFGDEVKSVAVQIGRYCCTGFILFVLFSANSTQLFVMIVLYLNHKNYMVKHFKSFLFVCTPIFLDLF